ncbi:B3 domain-containing protein-like protein [Salvia divinorum]|uniref:B3 domain-containing protein-like protein n=1 Tax=Salvia divinorum TaxID=28513 RepID=A0ABD1HJW2_SALDI
MGLRDIAIDDVKDLLHMKVDLFGALRAVAGRAKEIHEKEGVETKPAPPAPKRRGDEAGPAPKPMRQRRLPVPHLAEKPPLPAELHTAIEEIALAKNAVPTAAKLVIQKELYDTDLSSGHNRLLIPFNKIENDFLTEEEKQHLLGEDENGKKRFLEVRIVQPSMVSEETVKLCRWDMPKKNGKTSSNYVIRGNWTTIVKNNNLRLGETVQLWCFRVDRELCFMLVRVPRNRAS